MTMESWALSELALVVMIIGLTVLVIVLGVAVYLVKASVGDRIHDVESTLLSRLKILESKVARLDREAELGMLAPRPVPRQERPAEPSYRENEGSTERTHLGSERRPRPLFPAPPERGDNGRDIRRSEFKDPLGPRVVYPSEASSPEPRPVYAPEDPVTTLLVKAVRALESANQFVKFTEEYPGKGFAIDANGQLSPDRPSTPDKSDVFIISGQSGSAALLIPGFNMRRTQPLYTSDSGRAAQARLGNLFDIEPGDRLHAIEAALIDPNDFRVIKKGRLSLPMDKN